MDNGAAKLDQLAEKLLDVGKRNNMISFRDTKASTVEVLVPEAEELFEKVKTANTFEVFDPHISPDEEEPEEESVADKDEYVKQYAAKMKKQNQPRKDPDWISQRSFYCQNKKRLEALFLYRFLLISTRH